MEIRCTASKRYLLNIDIENYSRSINRLTGATVSLPLIMQIPCPKCKLVEEYHIYPTHYIHVKSYKREI